MPYQSGEIYFVREHELGSSSYSPLVKIGLVSAPRISEERLLEHQTGNPRRLDIPSGHVVRTEAVHMVEAQLHRRFARSRVGGEWFKFDDAAALADAVEQARELSLEAAKLVPLLDEADRLQLLPSNDEMLVATAEHLQVGESIAQAKEIKKRAMNSEDLIKEFLALAREKGENISGAATTRKVTFKPKFQEAEFKRSYADIYKQYVVEERVWKGPFLTKRKWSAEASFSSDYSRQLFESEAAVQAAISTESIADLGEPILALTRIRGLADWDETLNVARLKVACGLAAGIDGVCTWKRAEATTLKFDLDSFVKAHPDLYTSYLSDETTKEYLLPSKGSKRK